MTSYRRDEGRTDGAEVRACVAADLPVVRALLIETWHATYDRWLGADTVRDISATWHSELQLAAQVSRPDSLFLVAEDGAGMLGTAFAHVLVDEAVEIGRLYVRPIAQRLGIGKALLTAFTSGFPDEDQFLLDVEPRNGLAISFYQRHGFRVTGSGVDGGGSGLSHLRMTWQRPPSR